MPQYYGGYGRGDRVGSFQTYPGRAGALEKYRPAPYGDYSSYPRTGARSEPVYPAPPQPMPGYGYQKPMEPTQFSYWVFRIIGLIHIFLSILIFALAVAQFAVNMKELADLDVVANHESLITQVALGAHYYWLSIFDAAVFSVIAPLILVVGIVGFLHSPSRRNLEAVRNSFMVLSIVSALLCGCLVVYESIVHGVLYSSDVWGIPKTGTVEYTNYALWLCLIVFLAFEAILATVGASFACCSPGCCVPIINEVIPHTFVYQENEPLPPLFEPSYYGSQPPMYGPPAYDRRY